MFCILRATFVWQEVEWETYPSRWYATFNHQP